MRKNFSFFISYNKTLMANKTPARQVNIKKFLSRIQERETLAFDMMDYAFILINSIMIY